MIPTMIVSSKSAIMVLDEVGPDVKTLLADKLGSLAAEMAEDARVRAQAHIRFINPMKPGSYVRSIQGGLAKPKSPTRITGYVRSGHPVAHLMELGFTIKDLMIVPGTGKYSTSEIGALMAFTGDAGEVFRKLVHRHQTYVPPYPAIRLAFEARKGDIMALFDNVVSEAANKHR